MNFPGKDSANGLVSPAVNLANLALKMRDPGASPASGANNGHQLPALFGDRSRTAALEQFQIDDGSANAER